MSKYDPLRRHLETQAADEVIMSFADVERILGFPLPASAREHRPWWANESRGAHVQAAAWLKAGRQTARVDTVREQVAFVRTAPGVAEPGAAFVAGPAAARAGLSWAAAKLLADYTSEAGGDGQAALARALHEAAIARRGRLIDRMKANAPRVSDDSVALIREDRDGR
jgi:hypothetical protein